MTLLMGEPLYKRGDIVMIVAPNDECVSRPAMIVQSNFFAMHASVVILPITTELLDAPLFRITIQPNDTNGLIQPTQIMIDKPQTLLKEKLGKVIGHVSAHQLQAVERALFIFLGFA